MSMANLLKSLTESIPFRLIVLGCITIALQIPILMIDSLTSERSMTRAGAIQDIARTWGGDQSIDGPFLVVPYDQFVGLDKDKKPMFISRLGISSPDTLKIDAKVDTETRYRGIFEVPIFTSHIHFSGHFDLEGTKEWQQGRNEVHWNQAYIALGISDTKSLVKATDLEIQGKTAEFLPWKGGVSILHSGITVPLTAMASGSGDLNFSAKVELRGSGMVQFQPAGKETKLTMTSDWVHPSFLGAYLPATRKISPEGFSASWNIHYLSRNYPKSWTDVVTTADLQGNYFGVSLYSPVDNYRMVDRSVKYELIFVLMTFTAFFLFEILTGAKIHPVQYLLVGAAMTLFYLLLLSLTEHIGFMAAYISASILITAMIATYGVKVLGGYRAALVLGSRLLGLYVFLYTLLALTDYSLLVGAFGLTAALALVMYLTRNVNWFSLQKRISEESAI